MSSTPANQAAMASVHRPINPMRTLGAHLGMILLIGISATLIGVVAGLVFPPRYRASAVINVSPRYVGNLDGNVTWEGSSNSFINNQLSLISSYYILRDALMDLKDSAPEKYAAWGDEKTAPINLQEELDVNRLRDTNLIEVAIEMYYPEGIKETLDAVVKAYMERVRKGDFGTLDTRRDNLSKRRRELQTRLSEMLKLKSRIASDLGIMAGQDKPVAPYAQAVQTLNAGLAEAKVEKVKVEAELVGLKARMAKLGENKYQDGELRARAEQELRGEPEFVRWERDLDSKKASLKALAGQLPAKTYFIEQDNTNVRREASNEEEDIERRFDKQQLSAELAQLVQMRNELREKREQAVRTRIDKLILELSLEVEKKLERLANLQELEKGLEAQSENYRKQQATFTANMNEAEDMRNDIERLRLQISAIDAALDKFATEENSPGAISVQQMARYPEKPEHKHRLKLAGGIALGGWALAFILPLLIDFLNPWVREPGDVNAILRLPPLGWVIARTDERSTAFSRDQLRRIALALDEKRKRDRIRSIAVTSVKPGGGTTFLCRELAAALLELGLRPLVVEANAFRPDPTYPPASGGYSGLTGIIEGKSSLAESIVYGDAKTPDRVPVGETGNTRHLPARGRLPAILAEIAETAGRYDICLLDCPPILLSADAEGLARVADATLLVVEAEAIRLGEMRRAAGIIERIAKGPLAVVVNRVQVHKGGGYFANMLEEYFAAKKILPSGFFARRMRGGGKTT